MMKSENNIERIKEFFELIGNDKRYELRKYGRPVLVYDVVDEQVRYSLWEDAMLQRFGLQNVDGWDAKEESLFAPDWMLDEEDDDDFDDDDDDDF